ncbi:carboxylating nicotinate-nucleotide diphosphorylase [Brevundimonas faecalis]|uniref:carboxylating nicotinate-nucleotide diphosphorylase n=1 Tax=Brevundimonas faecalis TaxID=947378 RepID=UPI0036106177
MALAEDLGRVGDVTAQACIPEDARFSAVFSARQAGVMAGGAVARIAVHAMDPQAKVNIRVADGEAFEAGTVLVEVEANARALLAAERTALNLLGRMCGIATLTRTYVQAVEGTGARIADTRKTTPGLRALEKHAVACGGGLNHRFGLDDAVLIKDNHVAVCGGAGEAVRRARAFVPHLMKVEVEVDGLDQLDEVLPERPDVVMLDNFSLADLEEAVRRVKASAFGPVTLEASGGVNLSTVAAIAATGVDVISVGALTHSVPQLDVGLDAR